MLAAAVCALAPAGAVGASQTITLDGWGQIAADMGPRHLAYTDALTIVIDPADAPPPLPEGLAPFRYYRLDAGVTRLDGSGRRFVGGAGPQVTMRTSIGRLPAGDVDLTPDGRFVATAAASAFASPVVWCCTPDEGLEVVLESDGRAEAPIPIAVGTDGPRRTRWVARHADGVTRVHVVDPLDESAPRAVLDLPGDPLPGRVDLEGTLAAWVDRDGAAGAVRIARIGRDATPRTAVVGGTVREVHVADGEVLALTRVGARHRVVRVDRAGRTGRVWTGTTRPRVAIGGRWVAVAAGKRVLLGRRAPLREVRIARGRIAGLAVHGNRVAVFERRTVKRSRATVARIWSRS